MTAPVAEKTVKRHFHPSGGISSEEYREKNSPPSVERRQRDAGRGATPRRRPPSTSPGGTRQAHTGILIAEWFFGAVLIAATVPLEKTQTGYQSTMTTIMIRLSGLTGAFFALSLASEIPPARRFTMWFGLLIDLGIIYHASNTGAIKKIANVFGGKSIEPSSGTTLASDYTATGSADPVGLAGRIS